jgi:hypothetical protein
MAGWLRGAGRLNAVLSKTILQIKKARSGYNALQACMAGVLAILYARRLKD